MYLKSGLLCWSLTLLLLLSQKQTADATNKKIFFLKRDRTSEADSRLLVVTWSASEKDGKGCEIFDDKNLITEVLNSSSESEIEYISESDAKDILEKCNKVNIRRKRQSYSNSADYTAWRGWNGNVRSNRGNNWQRYVPGSRNYNPSESSWQNYGPLESPWQNYAQSESQWKNHGSPESIRNNNNGPLSSPETTWNKNNEPLSSPESPLRLNRMNRRQVQSSTVGTTSTVYTIEATIETGSDDSDSWNVIFPGTLWCGAGQKAAHYNDFGYLEDTDRCCREHDHCNDTIQAGETKYNLTNNTPFTQLSCECDNAFYDCLEKVDSVASNKIGNIYFNLLRKDCYESDYPYKNQCKTYRSLLKITCKEYAKDTSAPKFYQYKNPRTYRKLPIPGPIDLKLPSIL